MKLRVILAMVALSIATPSTAQHHVVYYSGNGCMGSSLGPDPCLANTEITFSAGMGSLDPYLDWKFTGGTGSRNKRVFEVPGNYGAYTMIPDPRGIGLIPVAATIGIVSGFAMDGTYDVFEADPAPVATFKIYKGTAPATTATIDYATADRTAIAGINYVATSGTLTFAPGEAMKVIKVPILHDDQYRHASFQFSISNPSMGTIIHSSTVPVLIVDDEPKPLVGFTETEYSGNEGGALDVTLVRTGSPEFPFNFLIDGAHSIEPVRVEFAAGELTKNVQIPVPENSCYRGPADLSLRIKDMTPGAGTSPGHDHATAHISDNEPLPSLTIGDSRVVEGDDESYAEIPIALTVEVCFSTPISFGTIEGTAKAGSDYEQRSHYAHLVNGRAILPVKIVTDRLMEPEETFFVEARIHYLPIPITTVTATCTIVDDDPPPAVVSIDAPAMESVPPGAEVHFAVALAVNVSGVDATDFAVIEDGVKQSRVLGVSGTGAAYDVALRVGMRSPEATTASVALHLIDDDTIVDELGNPLGGTGAGNGSAVSRAVAVHGVEPIPSLHPGALMLLAALLAVVALASLRA